MGWKSEDEEESAFLAEYPNLPDRTIGLLGVALVERRLKMAIKKKWNDSPDGTLLGNLFRIDGGLLGSVGSQIEIGYAVGLYDWAAAQDLKTCCKIRNDFAHRLAARDFSVPMIAAKCGNLKLPGIYPIGVRAASKGALGAVLGRTAVPDLNSPRGTYARTIELLITLLWGHLGFPKRLPPT